MALATSAAGWPAAAYGALVICIAGDFASTRSAWIFGAPFLALLACATIAHQVIMGVGARFGVPALFAGARAVNRVLDGRPPRLDAAGDADLAAALTGVEAFPVCNALTAAVIGLLVVVAAVLLEWFAAGAGSPNFGVIARGGFIADALYLGVSVTLAELLVRPACRALRRALLERDVPFEAGVLGTGWRLVATVVPIVAALLASVEVARSEHATTLAYVELVVLSVAVAAGLSWLQHASQERAARDVATACRALAAGEHGPLVTGSLVPALVGMATEFNAAARRVLADRRASTTRYRALFEGAGDAILLVDPASDRIIEASARAERLFGTPRETIVGRTLASCVDADTARRLGELDLHRPAPAEVSLVNATVQRADGVAVPVDASLSVVPAGEEWVLQAILRDVRDRQRIEQELRRAAGRFAELYRLAVGLVDDPASLAEHSVRALAELLQSPIAAVLRLDGDHATALALHEDGTLVVDGRRPVAGTPCEYVRLRKHPCFTTEADTQFPRDDWMRERGVRTCLGVPIFDGRGEVTGLVLVLDRRVRVFQDEEVQLLASFAWRVGLALERERLAAERDALTARLVESDRVKTEFLGMMSHELRTPLNILLGYTRMLLEELDGGSAIAREEQRTVLSRMLAGGLHLSELVEDTLSVLRLEAGVVQVDAAPLALREFFDELRGADVLLHRSADVVERWHVDDDVPLLVTDRRKLRQVVTNLVGNARKFTERGLIEVRASRAAASGVVVVVRDTGCGIAPDHLPHVFDLYRQAPSERIHDGCGLGLYIVRRYVALLGGTVGCHSVVGRGTTFVVTLPNALAPAAAAAA